MKIIGNANAIKGESMLHLVHRCSVDRWFGHWVFPCSPLRTDTTSTRVETAWRLQLLGRRSSLFNSRAIRGDTVFCGLH